MKFVLPAPDQWFFKKQVNMDEVSKDVVPPDAERISIPHTWNNLDGQDGGNNFLRCVSVYYNKFIVPKDQKGKQIFLEFEGVYCIATVFVNGQKVGSHDGGFSLFRYNISSYLRDSENIICVFADNTANNWTYPQLADFTFFGGIYRNVSYIFVDDIHFDLEDDGSKSIYVTSKLVTKLDEEWNVDVNCLITNPKGSSYELKVALLDSNGTHVYEETAQSKSRVNFNVKKIHRWNGIEDPHTYVIRAEIFVLGKLIDQTNVVIGFRTFSVERDGVVLNDKKIRCNGVSRHQDRLDKGWAVSPRDEKEDLELIREIGANAVRLAHYQQSENMYSLCDSIGFMVWAEVPYITKFSPGEKAFIHISNQMRELVKQNYNHPSIVIWGICNELTIGGESPELIKSLYELNKLVKKLDPNRITSQAAFMNTKPTSEICGAADILGYNLYQGWYVGEIQDIQTAIDNIQSANNMPLAITEYGSEANITLHTETPKKKDYTEEYHFKYHNEIYDILSKNALWGTFVWNMFDFAADSRNEGGVKGRNNKGLVTYDRKIKKDAFFAYKAKWSNEKFVHICQRRFTDRTVDEIELPICTNLSEVELTVNGAEKQIVGEIKYVKYVTVKLGDVGTTTTVTVSAQDGQLKDEVTFNRVDKPNESYVLVDTNEKDQWFFEQNDGYYSVLDTIGEILKSKQAEEVFFQTFSPDLMSGETLEFAKNWRIVDLAKSPLIGLEDQNEVINLNEKLKKIKKV